MDSQDHGRLQRRLELLEEALADSSDPDERRQLRNELLDVHRHLDQSATSGPDSTTLPDLHGPGPEPWPVPDISPPATPAASAPLGAYPDPWSDNDQLRWWNGTRWARRAKGMWGPVLTDQDRTRRPPEGRALTEGEQAAFGQPEPATQASGPPTQPGYYPDPFGTRYRRYFDGNRWDGGTYPPGGPNLHDLGVSDEQRRNAPPGAVDLEPDKPGFHPDPFGSPYERHFDGERWTDATHPAGGPTLADQQTRRRTQTATSSPGPPAGPAPARPRVNRAAATGFALSLVSIVLYQIGIIPILAVVFSAVGLGTYRSGEQSGRWMAGVGLAVGAIFTIMYLAAYGYLGLDLT